jgi:thioester reductase-like protein
MKETDTLDHEVAIIGMACRFPGAGNVDEFWLNVRDGVESISFFTDEELIAAGVSPVELSAPNYVKARPILKGYELFDASFFGFSPKDAQIMDPQHRLFLECAWEALENAGYNSETYKGRIGVYAGVGENTYLIYNILSNPKFIKSAVASQTQLLIANEKDYLATRVSYKLNLKGPSIIVQTSCSTSLVAVHLAYQSLLIGECNMAVAGAVSISIPMISGYRYAEGGIASPDGHCKAFDADAQGTIFGSGLGIVVLKRLEDALADRNYIHAIIKGSAVNNDGSSKTGYTAPSIDGQAEVIAEALCMAEVEPETIGYVEAHGTATAIGDPIEIAALTKAFGGGSEARGRCAIGSVKTNVGHLNTASGMAGLIKTVLALKHKLIPPSLHFKEPNPRIDFSKSPFFVNASLTEWESNGGARRAGVSSFGVGGTNAHIILEEPPRLEQAESSRSWQLLLLSAKTSSALETTAANLREHLQQQPDIELADVAYTLQVGRREFNHRLAVICCDTPDALNALETMDRQRVFLANDEIERRAVVFMFPGQGSQYVGMARELYDAEKPFRQEVDRCMELFRSHSGIDLRLALYLSEEQSDETTQQITQTSIAQATLFTVEYSLAKLWMQWGVRPRAMIGHSIGEYVAACLSEVLTLEDAVALVAARGKLMQQQPKGAMLSVPLSEQEVEPLLGERLSLAAINGPASCVISGPVSSVERLQEQLEGCGVVCRRLHTSHAFHSKMMEPILEPFTEQAKQVRLSPPKIPYISNVSGKWITAQGVTSARYWAEHLRRPVRFADGINELLKEPDWILLEVGPGQTLLDLVKLQGAATDVRRLFASLRRPQQPGSDAEFLMKTLGKLWLAGVQIDWAGFQANERRRRIPLPTYPFERQRYWVERGEARYGVHAQEPTEMEIEAREDSAQPLLHPAPKDNYVAPGDELERNIAWIYQDILGVEQVSVYDDFFELGGHSLLAVGLMARLQEATGLKLPFDILFQSPTVAELAQSITIVHERGLDAAIKNNAADDPKSEGVLDDSIRAESLPADYLSEPSDVFLTGVTGFLGAFLLNEILSQTGANVYCLVRASGYGDGIERIKKNLEAYSLWNESLSNAIIPVAGDLSQPLFGLSREQFDELSARVGAIYHNGAWVNWIYPYRALKPTNVLGTQEVLRLASLGRTKPVHYISSVAVFDSHTFHNAKVMREQDDLNESEGFYTGYGMSKWVAERMVEIADSRGIPTSIYRPAYVAGHSQTGACNEKDFIYRVAKSCVQLGMAPNGNSKINIAPVDYVSKALVRLSRRKDSRGKVFHLVNTRPAYWLDIVDAMCSFGYNVKLVPYQTWRAKLICATRDSGENALYPLLSMFHEPSHEEPTPKVEAHAEPDGRQYDCQVTLDALNGDGIICPQVDHQLINNYLSYLTHNGFLEEPRYA